MKKIIALFCLTLFLAPGVGSTQEFTRGSRTVYQAQFATWPTARSSHGYAGPEGGFYVLEATSNTWMGPGRFIPIAVLPGDFILDISFQVVHREDCSLNITLSDSGRDYSQLNFFLDLWRSSPPTFSIYENWVQNDFYVSIRRRFAERMTMRQDLSTADWGRANSLAIKREGNGVWFYLRGENVYSFGAPTFPVRKLGVGLSFRSKVLFRSVVARVPR